MCVCVFCFRHWAPFCFVALSMRRQIDFDSRCNCKLQVAFRSYVSLICMEGRPRGGKGTEKNRAYINKIKNNNTNLFTLFNIEK